MLNQYQYNRIGIVAKHCDLSKLSVAENEAINFDLQELFCGYWFNISEIIAEVEAYILDPLLPIPLEYAKKLELLNGGFYENNRQFQGIYNLIAYYSYARYVVLNGFSDTPNGLVQKTNEFSIPQDIKALNQFSEKYRNMGLISFKKISHFLFLNKEIFNYNYCGCNDCGITKSKGFGFKSSNINK